MCAPLDPPHANLKQKFKLELSRIISSEPDDRHLSPLVRNLYAVLCDSWHRTRCRGIRICVWLLQETQISTNYLRCMRQQDKPAQEILRDLRGSSIELCRTCLSRNFTTVEEIKSLLSRPLRRSLAFGQLEASISEALNDLT